MRKPRLGEVKENAQGHVVRKETLISSDSNFSGWQTRLRLTPAPRRWQRQGASGTELCPQAAEGTEDGKKPAPVPLGSLSLAGGQGTEESACVSGRAEHDQGSHSILGPSFSTHQKDAQPPGLRQPLSKGKRQAHPAQGM